MTLSTCQICLETIVKDVTDNVLLTNICSRNCSAHVCQQCLGRHIDVSLQQFYPGVLPRLRCPICLVGMHSSRWQDRVSADLLPALRAKYAALCHQACTLTPPCCHKSDYSHLPTLNLLFPSVIIMKMLPSQLEEFKTLCRQFCRHKVPPRVVLDYAFSTFGEEKATTLLTKMTLPRIVDVERRATLLLSLMYMRPSTKTICCGVDFCFNCKRSGHHESCDEDFDEDTSLVRCRSCRILVLKVEGCDAVNCVCGFSMNWPTEVQHRQQYKKKLLPVDMFDVEVFNKWQLFRWHFTNIEAEMEAKLHEMRLRMLTISLKPFLTVLLWRRRCRKAIVKELSDQWQARRSKLVVQYFASTKFVLNAFFRAYIGRWRFRHALLTKMESELFWSAYLRWHADELEAVDIFN